MGRSSLIVLAWLVSSVSVNDVRAAETLGDWSKRLTFFASFDESADADFAAGDRRVYTAANLSRQSVTPGLTSGVVALAGEGRWGKCLRFSDTSESVVFYRGGDNVPYDANGFAMTISFWMRLSPDEQLKPGYVDPLQITDKQWNDASVFVDFTKDETPRHFRLGVFSDFSFWNPAATPWEEIAETDRPMVAVKQPPFDRRHWTHVVITLDRFNIADQHGAATLYLDGAAQGTLARPQRFTWQPENVAVMLGIQYIGDIDDFAIFSGAMNADEAKQLFQLPNGVASLREEE